MGRGDLVWLVSWSLPYQVTPGLFVTKKSKPNLVVIKKEV